MNTEQENVFDTRFASTPAAGGAPEVHRAGIYETVESLVGGCLVMLIALEIIAGTILMQIQFKSGNLHVPKPISIPLLIVCVIMDGWLFIKTWRCISDRRFPLALEIVEMHPRLPPLLRPLAAIGWTAHGLVLVTMAFGMNVAIEKGWQYGQEFLVGVVLTILVFGMTFAANIYAVLAISSINPRSRLIVKFWKWRVWVDVALAALAWVLPWIVGRS